MTDKQGKPIAFAFIKDSQHNFSTFSDPNGAFTLNADPASKLLVTCSNYEESAVKIDNKANVVIVMERGGTAGTKAAGSNKLDDLFNVLEIGGTDRSARPLTLFGTAKEDLHGSPYLFNEWVHGYAITFTDSVKENDNYLFNYQKIEGVLLYTGDGKTMNIIDRTKIREFILFDGNAIPLTLENVPAIDGRHFIQVIATGSKYKIYKQFGTKFVQANFQTNGITSSGNNYDEFKDESVYYVVSLPGGSPQKIVLKRKSIKTAFAAEADKVSKFMTDHDSDEIDDTYLKNIGDYMNN